MTARHAAPKKRRKQTYEDDVFAKMLGRLISAMERRASENPDALAYMLTLRDEMGDAIDRAGYRLNTEAGFSLGRIAYFLSLEGHKMTRQNAVKRWGPAAMARKMGVATITARLNEKKKSIDAAAVEVFGDELAQRRAAKRAAELAAEEAAADAVI